MIQNFHTDRFSVEQQYAVGLHNLLSDFYHLEVSTHCRTSFNFSVFTVNIVGVRKSRNLP